MKIIAAIAVTSLVGALAFQDPVKPASPPPPAPVTGTAAEVPGQEPRDALEGVYVLRSRFVSGAPDADGSRGYVAITRRHMLLVLAGPGSDPDYPLLRAGVRRWEREKAGVGTTIELGFFTDADGEIHVEEPGERHVRRIDIVRGKLRIWQDEQSFLDFERLE